MKIKSMLAVAALIGLFAAPAKAVTISYDIKFDFTNSSLDDVIGHLTLNSPPLNIPTKLTYNNADLSGLIASFSVNFTNPADSFSCLNNGCVFNAAGFGGFTGLTFDTAGTLTGIGADINTGQGSGTNANILLIGNADLRGTGTNFRLNPPGNNNDVNGIIITQVAPVPGPAVGAGLPGVAMALGGLVLLSRRRRNHSSVA